MVNLYRMCGGDKEKILRQRTFADNYEEFDEADFEEHHQNTLKEKIAIYIIDPKNKYKVAWDMCMGFLYLSVYFMDPFIYAFHFYHLIYPGVRNFSISITMVLVFNMLIKPLTGVKKEDKLVQNE